MNNNVFTIENGSIYENKTGKIIETMSAVIDKNVSLLKYGDAKNGLYDYYIKMIKDYRKGGLEDIANDLVYIEFNKYEEILTIEEICTFANYMVMCSCNGQNIYKMLQMELNDLKDKINSLSKYGY